MVSTISGELAVNHLTHASNTNTATLHRSTTSQGASASTTVRSMCALREVDEKLYNGILMGLAMKTCQDSERSLQRTKKANREALKNT